jgi:hypothetical protein
MKSCHEILTDKLTLGICVRMIPASNLERQVIFLRILINFLSPSRQILGHNVSFRDIYNYDL